MNQETASATARNIFRQEIIAFKKVPKQSKLFKDYVSNVSEAARFYPEKNTPLTEYARKVLANYKTDRERLCDALRETNRDYNAGRQTLENIELLRNSDCLAIVTGQQAGLFSGALYTIYKALSAIKLASELKKQNIKAVPIFWIAEEDHDFDEVKKTTLLNSEGKLITTENTPKGYQENLPVGLVNLDDSINKTISDLFKQLPYTEFSDDLKHFLSETYRSKESYSQAFGKFIAKIFSDYGLIILSPLNKKLKSLSAPIFEQSVEKSSEISSKLLDRNRELTEASYEPQVLVEKDFFPFFLQNENGERQALKRDAETREIQVQKSKTSFSEKELAQMAKDSPEKLSPNALMRPIVQDFILPTLVYFGGAAEIAYFAQNSVIYKILSRPITPIRHRASFTIVERKHLRTMEKYESTFEDLFEGKEKFEARVVEKFLNRDSAKLFTETENIFENQLNVLEKGLQLDEPTLAANLETRRKKINWHLSALRKKYHQAEILNNKVAARRIENLFIALLPENALQERAININYFLNSYGRNFIDWLYEFTEPTEVNHQILYL